jgi:hypothetical protein
MWPRPDRLGEEWTCPECGNEYVSTRAKHVLGPKVRPDAGYDNPEMLGWRGATPP